ncbi:hypothetical protein [Rhodospirillum rubrum]|uniref:O-antigen polymerase n=1 Tax=Rhodospirillum rubrum (strain ATCC 11170 / ATH 1.1.1 / DSM 467 / LMG 4362 / NCIMB 8255 / S1) TaxID=269796 RepID=Q2RMY3_RHORT|nr:hypothetical protein [Rhodospirillum rubrum]ABC24512.1 hypothetical protein Rru_A3718 [Rhodospirillum rubrum ATCC 11170]AEO50264.1 hypothetical protein F11_19020 [Rhodospirillum rubrum F11]MBK5956238.1 hypothetical protein [Rhodospirillum rubrum]QXG80429.1 hypothetical protein KUL73_19180 [Rhodospirillum rubrum]HAP99727.1 hypothetical protein [Rhodospirillum rubrum]
MSGGRGRVLALKAGGGRIRPLAGTDAPPLPRPMVGDGVEAAGGVGEVFGSLHWKTVLVFVSLPMVLQVFHYMIDVGPVYYLSKIWPLALLPLGLKVFREFSGEKVIYGFAIVYLTGVTPIMSMIHFDNNVVDALATTVKVWPLTYFFSFLGLLWIARPQEDRLRAQVLGLGLATLAVMWLMWIFIPKSFYSSQIGMTKLFLWDELRSYHIYFPMTFSLILLFYSVRRFLSTHRAWIWMLPALFGLLTMAVILKQRTTIAAALVVVGLIVLRRLPRPMLIGAVALGGALAVLGGVIVLLAPPGGPADAITSLFDFGGSLSVRQQTAAKAAGVIFASPLSWILGSGAITRLSPVTLNDIFASKMFFLADIGWLGVLFEYGAIGSILIALVYAIGLRRALRSGIAPPGSPAGDFRGALGDMIVMVSVETLIYSPVFTPGIVAGLTAFLIYLDKGVPARGGGMQRG